ncbi:MAG TPA: gliding motility-associated C-terminal domain-containing protein, partial [Bacteroidales bacterium]|nr:gliding motility-associated C-terminal domain-containing protein [Bacteroidales bacterium]HPS74722.1 gliding motility-associated C-terminal domain-containing protein [Bacteroidales bacterium]
VPNAFAPLSGINGASLFKPVGINLKKYHIQVFNTWGELLWESNLLDEKGRPTEGWNGINEKTGEIYPQGTYLWRIDAVFIDGKIWEGSSVGSSEPSTYGLVTLVR